MDTDPQVTRITESVRAALDAEDLDAFADLLDPRVAWGAPGARPRPARTATKYLPGTGKEKPTVDTDVSST